MDIKTYIQQQIENMRGHVDSTMKNMTDEQFNWLPPGKIKPICAIFIHMVTAEDDFVHAVFQRKLSIWEDEEWSDKTGVETPPGPGRGWETFTHPWISVAPLLTYQQSVRAATEAYLAKLTDKELERRVVLFGRDVPVAEVLMTLVVHSSAHAGEIAAMRGMQGVQGLPY